MANTLHPDDIASAVDETLGGTSARTLLRDPAAAVERVVQGAHEAIDRVAAHAVPAAEQLAQRASSANTALHDKADRLGEIQEQWLNDARDTVRDHPLTSVLAAAAIGMIIARLTSR